MKKSIVIAAILILALISTAIAQEATDDNVVVVGSDGPAAGEVPTDTADTAVVVTSADAQADTSSDSSAEETSEYEPDQGVCAPESNIITAAYSKARSLGNWAITRDYPSAASNAWKELRGLSLGIKAVIILAFLILIYIIWNNNFRNSRANNLKKARAHHLKGEEAHRKGDEEEAREHYEKAREYRERAQDQW